LATSRRLKVDRRYSTHREYEKCTRNLVRNLKRCHHLGHLARDGRIVLNVKKYVVLVLVVSSSFKGRVQ
jgi:hypothetical protein